MGKKLSNYWDMSGKAVIQRREWLKGVLQNRLKKLPSSQSSSALETSVLVPGLKPLLTGSEPRMLLEHSIHPLANLRSPAIWMGSGYECCYCWKIGHTAHIHEIILTRGDARGDSEREVLVHDPRNCGWVDYECHPEAEGKDGTIRGIQYLSRYVGWEAIYNFLSSMKPYFTGIIDDKVRLVQIAQSLV